MSNDQYDHSESPFVKAIERRGRNHNDERIHVVYFENREGHVLVAPDFRHPTPDGYERKECHTLREIDHLTRLLNHQDRKMFERMFQEDYHKTKARHDEIRSKLTRRKLSADCGLIETLFIDRMFQYMDRKEKTLLDFKVRGYFHQREFDSKSAKIDDYGKQLTMPKLSDRLASALTK